MDGPRRLSRSARPLASIAMDSSNDRVQKPGKRSQLEPADFDLEDLDAGTQGWRHPHDVLCGRDETRVQALGVAAQPFEFGNAERVMIGKCPCADDNGAEGSQCRKEFFGPPDPGEG